LPKPYAAKKLISDSSAIVALLSRGDQYHDWINAHVDSLPWPWLTCDAALSEAFYLVGDHGTSQLVAMLRRGVLRPVFNLDDQLENVLRLMEKYVDVPMSLADACLVRMSETLADSVILTTDRDFRFYRRHSRQVIPCLLP
jgi:predicted nucleic acid-binding protein